MFCTVDKQSGVWSIGRNKLAIKVMERKSIEESQFFYLETTPRHTFLCSDSQCLPPGDPRILCAKHGYPITGKSFIVNYVNVRTGERCLKLVNMIRGV